MNDKLNMDKQVREKLENFSLTPPPHVFNNVQAQLAAQRKKTRMIYLGWIAAAAVIVFAFIAGWNLKQRSDKTDPVVVEQKMILAPNKNEKPTQGNNLGNTQIAQNKQEQQQNNTPQNTLNQNTPTSVVQELEIEDAFVASVERITYELMESLEAFMPTQNIETNLAERQTEQLLAINTNDAIRIAQNAKNYNKQKQKEKGWIVGAHVSPGYSSQTTSYSEQYANNMDYSATNGNGNIGGGFSVQYKTNKRIRVESGVYYSQNGQSSNNNSHRTFARNKDYGYFLSMSDAANAISSAPAFSNTVQANNQGISMNSTAGVINMKTTPKGASLSTFTETISAKNTSTLNTNGEFSQAFEFVEIPLYLRYSVLDKKIGIELLGGINAGIVVGNNAYINNEYGKQNIGSTEDISNVNFSGTVGVGVNYALGKRFSLAMEPRLNYYLSSINTNPEVSYKPYRVGFYTGIYYEF